ncbi:MAG: TonB-dependent receptor [Rhodothermaceae bacterium]|nr:MAG: TonB-dependent receptor [Rhodothermaceae bacterium]
MKAVCSKWMSGAVLIYLVGCLCAGAVCAQTATVRGFVTDAENGEPLQGVNVVLEEASGALRGTVTDGDGVYGIGSIPPGRYRLRVSFIGYVTHLDTLDLPAGAIEIINIALVPGETQLEEVVVESEEETGAAGLRAGMQSIRPKEVDVVPMPDVSGDLAVFLTTLPGVVTLGDRGGQFYVRGGEPAHNLVLLDGMYVHQPFHLLNFYSAFPADIINRADFYAAGYGSPFSGRISSVLDVYSRNGNKRQYAGAVSVAPFMSSLLLEGPLLTDRLSFLASVRRSVIEHGAQHYIRQPLPFQFGDAFGKLHFVVNENHQLSISALSTYDQGSLEEPAPDRDLEEIRWRNRAVGVRYLFLPKRVPFVGEILLSYSSLRSEWGDLAAPERYTEFDGFNYAINMTHHMGSAQWKWGLFWRAPEITSVLGGLFQNVEFGFSRRHKAGAYVEPDLLIGRHVRVRLGLIAQLFPGQRQPSIFEPRARIAWHHGIHEVNFGMGLYHQEVFGLNDRRDATNLFTAWRSAPMGDLSRALHLLLGYRVQPVPWLEVAAEGYLKRITNLYIAEWTAFPRLSSRLQEASGRVAGLDLRLEVRRPRFHGYVTYSLSSVLYEAEQAALQLWYGVETLRFHPPHDQRHQINLVAATRLAGVDLSLRWSFGSGRPFSRVYGFDGFVFMHGVQDLFEVPDEQRVIYERPFQGVLPTYHRLDVSAERRFDLGGPVLTAQAGVLNVYDRRNLLALDVFTQRRTDQLPVLPTVGLKLEFN